MKIKEVFDYYENFKENTELNSNIAKVFSNSRRAVVFKHLKKYKKEIIESINYSYFESNENILLSIFQKNNKRFVHINSSKTENFPKYFQVKTQYEVYLSIFATICILYGFNNCQLENLDDSRLDLELKSRIEDICFKVYYDDDFNFNLSDYLNSNFSYLRIIFIFGKDFTYHLIKNYYFGNIEKNKCLEILNCSEEDFKELYNFIYNKYGLSKELKREKLIKKIESVVND